jgi:hypothetical protein
MKNILSIAVSGFVIAFALQSCNQPKVDTAKEMAQIDSMANSKLAIYRDSLQLICMNDVMAMAQARSDSMMQAAMKSSGGAKPKPVPPKPAPTNPDVKVTGKKGMDTTAPKVTGKKGTDTTKVKVSGKKDVPPKNP